MSKKKSLQSKKKEIKRKLKKSAGELSIPDKSQLQAIALKYDLKKRKVPQVVALGKGKIAESILSIAEEYEVPLYEDKTLANILSKLQIKSNIPANLFKIIAEVLAFIYYLEKVAEAKRKSRDKFRKIK